jgi:Zn-dependent peptidase ImmA (M78 family)
LDELTVLSKARQFMAGLDLSKIHTDLSVYIDKVRARLKTEDLGEGESGYTLTKRDGTSTIIVNEQERFERQRFSVCHEIGHIVLELGSSHEKTPPWSYAKRHENEIWCDMFAAELLMPYEMLKIDIDGEQPSFEIVERIRAKYITSFPATASRVAALTDYPCAFVTMDAKIIRYAARSAALRKLNAWVAPKTPIPEGSVASRLSKDGERTGADSNIAQDLWFTDWLQGYDLTEMARHYPEYDQTFSLLWFEDDDGPAMPVNTFSKGQQVDDGLLKELDGILPWPGRKKRR